MYATYPIQCSICILLIQGAPLSRRAWGVFESGFILLTLIGLNWSKLAQTGLNWFKLLILGPS